MRKTVMALSTSYYKGKIKEKKRKRKVDACANCDGLKFMFGKVSLNYKTVAVPCQKKNCDQKGWGHRSLWSK